MKKIWVLCGLCVMLLCSCGNGEKIDTEGIEGIAVEVLDIEGKSIEHIDISEDDAASIKEILSAKEQNEDNGFVFAEGMYRIVLKYEEKCINLYPYCGNASTIRVGDSGASYIEMESEQQEALEAVIEEYIDITGGIWEWEEYEDN